MIIEHKGHKIEIYDNTQNLPILRFQKFNKYIMMANEIGSTFEDYDRRTQKALEFLHKDMKSEAIQELANRRQTIFNAYNNYSPSGKAFAVLVRRIDGKEYPGISPDELDEVLQELERIGLANGTSMEKMMEVKKKSTWSFRSIFQRIFRKPETPITQRSDLSESKS